MKLILSRMVVFFICAMAAKLCYADLCNDLRKKFLMEKTALNSDLKLLEENIKKDNLCVKNLFGVLLATGDYFERDMQKAYSVFYDLSERNYPPATLNLAIFIAKDEQSDISNVIYILLGIYANNLSSKNWSAVAIDARDFGQNLIDKKIKSAENQEQKKVFEHLKDVFEGSVKKTTAVAASELLKQYEVQRQQEDLIAGLFMLGLAASKISNIESSQNLRPTLGLDPQGRLYHLVPSRTNIYWGVPLR